LVEPSELFFNLVERVIKVPGERFKVPSGKNKVVLPRFKVVFLPPKQESDFFKVKSPVFNLEKIFSKVL